MKTSVQVEVRALVEKIERDDMPVVAAAILHEWCIDAGVSRDSISEFVSRMVQSGEDDRTRHLLADMMETYETGKLLRA